MLGNGKPFIGDRVIELNGLNMDHINVVKDFLGMKQRKCLYMLQIMRELMLDTLQEMVQACFSIKLLSILNSYIE